MPMSYQEVFGIRVYHCVHRRHHAVVYRNLYTGELVREDELQEVQPDG